MNYKPENIESYRFAPSDNLIFDTNVWMYIQGIQAHGSDKRIKIYTEAYKRILTAGSKIFIDVLIMSEFINRCARIEWELFKDRQLSTTGVAFKTYRNSKDFIAVAKGITSYLRVMLNQSQRVDNSFKTLLIDDLINEYESGGVDFNDQVLISTCEQQSFKFITDDGDFKKRSIQVITANKKLI